MVSTHAGCSSSATSVSHSHFLPDCDLIFIFIVSFDDSNFSFYWDQMCSESHLVVSNSLRSHGLCSPWNSPAQNTGVGSLSLLQGIFPTQGLNPGLPHCRWILYQLSHKESPRILEQVAFRFSRWSSRPRNRTGVSCIAGRFFTNWAIRKALKVIQSCPTLCNPMVYIVHGILQAIILEWGAFPFSRGSSQHRDRTQVSRTVGRFFTSWATF